MHSCLNTFSYSHTVLLVVYASKLFLCWMTCMWHLPPLPTARLWVPQFVMALPIPSTMPYLLWHRERVTPLPLFVPALQMWWESGCLICQIGKTMWYCIFFYKFQNELLPDNVVRSFCLWAVKCWFVCGALNITHKCTSSLLGTCCA